MVQGIPQLPSGLPRQRCANGTILWKVQTLKRDVNQGPYMLWLIVRRQMLNTSSGRGPEGREALGELCSRDPERPG